MHHLPAETETVDQSSRLDAAAHVLSGMLAHQRRYQPRITDQHLHWHDAIAKEAVQLTDALLRALK